MFSGARVRYYDNYDSEQYNSDRVKPLDRNNLDPALELKMDTVKYQLYCRTWQVPFILPQTGQNQTQQLGELHQLQELTYYSPGMNVAPAEPANKPEFIIVDTFPVDLSTAECGLPFCCPGKQPKFVKPDIANPYLSDTLDAKEEIDVFLEDLSRTFRKTGLPMMPMVLGHLCLPFSPICVEHGFRKWRRKKLAQIVQEFNDRNRETKGIYMEWNKDYWMWNEDPGKLAKHQCDTILFFRKIFLNLYL